MTEALWKPVFHKEETIELLGFSIVKRWNTRFRLTLWVDKHIPTATSRVRKFMFPASFEEYTANSMRYTLNAARIAKHAVDTHDRIAAIK